MSLLPNYNPQNLEDVLKQGAASQTAGLTDQYQNARKRAVASQAANGRLMSGVSEYPLTDLDTQYQQNLSGIQGNLAHTLGNIPTEDWLNQNEFARKLGLTDQIAALNKPSTLDEIFKGIGAAGQVAGTFAAFG